jgi:acyl-coenzyme A thioesterase PaaI-like protein
MAEPLVTPSGARWLPDDSPPGPQRVALHRLAAALRQCTELLMNTEAPEDELNAAAEAAERFAARLAEAPHERPLWGWAESSNSGDSRAMFDSSPLIGLGNPVAPPLRLTVVDNHVEGTATFGTAYEGPPGHVHGGIIAASFDEVLGMVQSVSGAPGMTGTLAIRYLKPTPLHHEVYFTGRVDRREGRKIYTSGTLTFEDTLCATAEGLFISVPLERMRQLATDRQ